MRPKYRTGEILSFENNLKIDPAMVAEGFKSHKLMVEDPGSNPDRDYNIDHSRL